MYCVVLMAALAGPEVVTCPGGYGGGVYAHGYGLARPVMNGCCGVVLPPCWPDDPTPPEQFGVWFDYVNQLEGYEREEMLDVWFKATPEARLVLLGKLERTRLEAAIYRARVERERDRELNRPLTEEELQVWQNYLGKLKGEKKQDAQAKWKGLDNRGKRLYLKEIQKKEDNGQGRLPRLRQDLARR